MSKEGIATLVLAGSLGASIGTLAAAYNWWILSLFPMVTAYRFLGSIVDAKYAAGREASDDRETS